MFGWGFWASIPLWQLLEDLKSSVCIFSCAWCFAVAAAATGIKSVAVMSQPGAVWTVRVFETHHVTILHRDPIICVPGVDLEGDVGIDQPGVSCYGTGESTKTTSLKSISLPFSQFSSLHIDKRWSLAISSCLLLFLPLQFLKLLLRSTIFWTNDCALHENRSN